VCHMSRPPHPPWFDHPNNIRWRIQAMKFIIMQLSPRSVFLPFRSTYPLHHVLKNPQSIFLLRTSKLKNVTPPANSKSSSNQNRTRCLHLNRRYQSM
jgi:hypothetical protein